VEQGTFESLMMHKGVFASLVQADQHSL
jgi:hypothetical protein